jgi:hypothetical protein
MTFTLRFVIPNDYAVELNLSVCASIHTKKAEIETNSDTVLYIYVCVFIIKTGILFVDFSFYTPVYSFVHMYKGTNFKNYIIIS